MAESIKYQIRRNAQHQRERDAGLAGVNGGLNFIVEPTTANNSCQLAPPLGRQNAVEPRPDTRSPHRPLSGLELVTSVSNSSISQSFISASPPTNLESGGANATSSHLTSLDDPPSQLTDADYCSPTASDSKHFEEAFLAKYLDDVFPYIFPFYRPSVLETGRSWILSLLRHSDVARHAVLSLTTYYVTAVLEDVHPGEHESCKKLMWSRLSEQTGGYLKRIQEQVDGLRVGLRMATTLERARSMESIIQALIFEVALGRSGSWKIHLAAALGLFDEMIRHQQQEEADPTFLSLLNRVGKPAWYALESDSYIWDSEQAGFRFFTALLVFLDAIGSTAMEQSPRLLDHYPLLLAHDDDCQQMRESIPLRLSAYVGCQNWVITAIAEVAALSKWKNDMKSNGSLSVMELAMRARCIEKTLDEGILGLENGSTDVFNAREKKSWFSCGQLRSAHRRSSALATNIWARAAQIYLTTVVSGWQPCNVSIRTAVRRILFLLQKIDSPGHLRTLTWPIVVAGSLAQRGEEQQQVRAMLDDNSEMKSFGTMATARDILVKLWENQGVTDRDTWDLPSCLRVLGFPALLI
ncbi:MAG: hypothetical protein Q9165_006823 [Trypethelium subeluteriae]